MSTMNCLASYFFCALVILNVFFFQVDSVPLKRVSFKPTPYNFTRIPPTKATFPKNKSTGRNGRFFGKLSLVAGLGLPQPVTPSISHRDDSFEHHRVVQPTQYVTSFNFPPSRWGPYVAAVYEPSPILSFFENPFGYLAAILNPYNWFDYTESSTTTNSPENPSTASPPKEQSNIVVYVHDSDNEIPNEERETFADRAEMKMELDEQTKHKLQKLMSSSTTGSYSTIGTTASVEEDDTDLLAEETTMKLVHENIPDEIQSDEPQPPIQNLAATTKKIETKATTVKPTTVTTTTTTTTTAPTTTTVADRPSDGAEEVNGTESTTSQATSQTPNTTTASSTWYPYYHHGYYYHGNPQNVNHIEFTTQPPVNVNTIPPARFDNFNDIDRVPQNSHNYFDSYDQQNQGTFDHYNFDQLPPRTGHYYQKDNYLASNFKNTNNLHGFKPSPPLFF